MNPSKMYFPIFKHHQSSFTSVENTDVNPVSFNCYTKKILFLQLTISSKAYESKFCSTSKSSTVGSMAK